MGVLQLRLALALVACAALFITGCPEPQGKESKDPLVNKEDKPATLPNPAPVAQVETPLETKKPTQSPPGEPDKPAQKEDSPPITLEKWGFAAVEKAWGLKCKSVAYTPTPFPPRYTFVVEFTRDLMPEELQALKVAFPFAVRPGVVQSKVDVYFFDKDNVIEANHNNCQALTELTGEMGDAFRLSIQGPARDKAAVVVRAELRLVGELRRGKDKDK